MTDFYRFPAMAKLSEWTNKQQVNYIIGEADEARIALANMNASTVESRRRDYGMELMDVIHSAETALRMEFTDEEVEHLHRLTIEKNRKRGYYDD